jgi:hypothetical protein
MTRQAIYQSGEEPRAGDLVRRTGESARGLVQGEDYVVEGREPGPTGRLWLRFAESGEDLFRPGGFSLIQRKEGES